MKNISLWKAMLLLSVVSLFFASCSTAKNVKTSETTPALTVSEIKTYIVDNGGNCGHQYEVWRVLKLSDGSVKRFNLEHRRHRKVTSQLKIGDKVFFEKDFWGEKLCCRYGKAGTENSYPEKFLCNEKTQKVIVESVAITETNDRWGNGDELLLKTSAGTYRLCLQLIDESACWALFLKKGDHISITQTKDILLTDELYLKKGDKTAHFYIR